MTTFEADLPLFRRAYALRAFSRASTHVRAQLFVLDEPLNVRVAPRPLGGAFACWGLLFAILLHLGSFAWSLSAILYPGLRRRTRPALPVARGARPFAGGDSSAASSTSGTRSTNTNVEVAAQVLGDLLGVGLVQRRAR